MAALQPLYTPSNCTFSGPLRWGVTIFWRAPPPASLPQGELAAALERDGVRLLGHRFCEPRVSQFALSTLAGTTPLHVVSRLKGRLQYLIRASVPKASKPTMHCAVSAPPRARPSKPT